MDSAFGFMHNDFHGGSMKYAMVLAKKWIFSVGMVACVVTSPYVVANAQQQSTAQQVQPTKAFDNGSSHASKLSGSAQKMVLANNKDDVNARGSKKKTGGGKRSSVMPPSPVEAIVAVSSSWQQTTETTGTLHSMQGVMVASMVAGQVEKILFSSNQQVRKGDTLFVIYHKPLQEMIRGLKAKYELSNIRLRRGRYLVKRGAISASDFDTLKYNNELAKANYQQGLATLDQHIVKAPFAGKLGIRLVNVGDYIQVGEDTVDLQDLSTLRVDFSIPQIDMSKLMAGARVRVTLSGQSRRCMPAVVTSLAVSVDKNNRSILVRSRAKNLYGWLPGSFVMVTVPLGKPKVVVRVPLTAIDYEMDATYVFLLQNGMAIKRPVHIVAQNATDAILDAGVVPGDKVVTAGLQKVYNHAAVVLLSQASTYDSTVSSSKGVACG